MDVSLDKARDDQQDDGLRGCKKEDGGKRVGQTHTFFSQQHLGQRPS